MKPVLLHLEGLSAISEPHRQLLTLVIEGRKFTELHALINKALNTHENPPQWAIDLADALEVNPIPRPVERQQ